MNDSEMRARDWLRATGIEVTFQSRRSPDFIDQSGHGYEVKFSRNNSIVFFESQLPTLKAHGDVTVLIMDATCIVPLAQIPFSDIPEPPSRVGQWRFLVGGRRPPEETGALWGNLLRALRASLGETQEQLAGRLGVSPNTVARWESGVIAPGQYYAVKLRRIRGQVNRHAPVAVDEVEVFDA